VQALLVQIHSRLELQDANRLKNAKTIGLAQPRTLGIRVHDGVQRETLKDVDDDNYLVIVVDEAHVIFELKQQVVRVVYTRLDFTTLVYDIAAIFMEIAFP
nr:hypothetical protein [Tanacetum cinerariifolium]